MPRKFLKARRKVRTAAHVREAGYDGNGMPREGWADPRDQYVYGWQSTNSYEPKLAGPNRVVVEVELLAPESFECGPKDRVWLNGARFDVIGYPEDANEGPFGFRPGFLVNLKRSEG
ncbi:hypothetical protein CH253_08130 [Rhodococcus sp. 06-156-3C]|nr:hypothetical protein CH253_08130 [Rhodococcus sp. 06-156-3C]